ncbi:intraflagellar transport protein 43-like isoform X1 [Solea senegalensis]|uniref:Intraflagellar transport protein 43-like isoform X1 n=1 Tax=Solea senegalensis TaxID=28829 RepID=A0AAV6S155_SOLSE|nr:intraflagellar transport protein 43-like isoform X1 [Solea senegalensis]
MDENFPLGDTGAVKNAVKSGRRARLAADQSSLEDSRYARKSSTSASMGEAPPPKPARRQGGWAEESSGSGSAKSSRRPAAEDLEDRRLQPQTPQGSDDEGDIPVIPDLEEVQEEDLTMQVAAPPSIQVNRVMTYRDLDNDLKYYSAFQTLDGEIDLKLLTKVLAPEQEVKEDDVSWDWDHLFTEVSSELLMEWDQGENEEQAALPLFDRRNPFFTIISNALNRVPIDTWGISIHYTFCWIKRNGYKSGRRQLLVSALWVHIQTHSETQEEGASISATWRGDDSTQIERNTNTRPPSVCGCHTVHYEWKAAHSPRYRYLRSQTPRSTLNGDLVTHNSPRNSLQPGESGFRKKKQETQAISNCLADSSAEVRDWLTAARRHLIGSQQDGSENGVPAVLLKTKQDRLRLHHDG